MTDSDGATAGAGDLAAVVEEHPEEVARFLDRLDLVNDLLDTAELATAAMDDRMAREVSGTASDLAAAADGLATPQAARLGEATGENAEELADAMETLVRLQRSGTLDDLADLVEVGSLATAALDDDMVTELAATGTSLGELADTAAEEDVSRTIQSLLIALGEAGAAGAEPVGSIGLLRALRDPEVKRGLGFIVAVSRAMGRTLPKGENGSS